MKLIHLGDLHLGRSLLDFDLIPDQEFMLRELLKLAEEREVDGVLIAGDVYDRAVPSEAAVNLLDRFLCALSERGIGVFMISGNHDSDDRLHFGSSLLTKSGVHIASRFDGTLTKHTLGGVNIFLLPFVKASQVRRFYPDETIENYQDAVSVILKNADIDEAAANVLVAHQFVAGSDDPVPAGSEGMSVMSVGAVERISAACFNAFSYVALGHIHGAQQVGRETVRYCGSPIKYSLSEVQNLKSVPVITFSSETNIPDVELVPLTPMRELRHIRGGLSTVLNEAKAEWKDDFIYVTLTDEEYLEDVIGKLRTVYPNTIRVDYDNERTRGLNEADLMQLTTARSFDEMITDFYRELYGTEISEDEMRVMREAARETGVIHEAD